MTKLSKASIAALDAAGVDTDDVAIWLRDAIVDNYNSNTSNTMTMAEDWAEWTGIDHVIEIYGEGPYNEGLWSEIWKDDVKAIVETELNAMMRNRIIGDYSDRISRADDIVELRKLLNAADAWAKDAGVDVESIYKSTDLPTFGGSDLSVADVYSWDATYVLTYRADGTGWHTEAREDYDHTVAA